MAVTRPRAAEIAPAAPSLGPPDQPAATNAVPRLGVVLAAGRSDRLEGVTGGRSKAIFLLGGTTLIERAVRALGAAGVRNVVVVAGFEAELVETAVAELEGVTVVRAENWELGNGASLAAAERAMAGEGLFAVLNTDHVFADGTLDQMLRTGEPAVLIDPAPARAAWAEGTRVRMDDGVPVAFGKHLPERAIDCGAFVLSPDIFGAHRRAAAGGDHSLAAAVTEMAARRPLKAVRLPEGSWWQDVDTPDHLRTARGLVRRSLVKATDGPVSRHLNRPISTRLTMALAPLRIHPDALSLLFFVVGMVAAWSLSAGRGLVGGLLIQSASVLDGVDGEMARLRGMATARGATLDALLDRMVDAAVVAGLGLWLWTDPSRSFRALIIAASAIGWASIALLAKEKWQAIPALERPPATERRLGLLLGGRDGRSLVLASGAVVGHPEVTLIGAAVAWALTVVLRTLLLLRRQTGHRAHALSPQEVGHAPKGDLEEIR